MAETIEDEKKLRERLADLASTPVLLVACDYDGTVAPIVADPEHALPKRETITALRGLSELRDTEVAVISGRSLRELDRLAGLPGAVHLVGSHGSEFDPDFAERLTPGQRALLARWQSELEAIADSTPGLSIENKPASLAFHYRKVSDEAGDAALKAVLAGPGSSPGVHLRHGKKVVELSLFSTNKGDALERLRSRVGATAVVFIGDDVTDEDAFATLKGPDVGVKVGAGQTRAAYRVGEPGDVARLLAFLLLRREAWGESGSVVPIESHSLLSDQRSMALLNPHGRITWLCLPRVDSPATFAELVDGPAAGYFAIRPAEGGEPTSQVYRDGSMVLETRWPTFTVTDFFDCSLGRPQQRAGRSDLLRVVQGSGRVVAEFAPRLDFGRVPTQLSAHASGLRVEGALDPLVLRAPRVDWEIVQEGAHHTARAEFELDEQGVVFDLRYGTGSLEDTQRRALQRRDLTDSFWSSWANRLVLPSVASDLVLRSALTLKALCHEPSGAIAAAATTSLPEHLGGVRNWDYRYCWLRDGALTARALLRLESQSEAMAYLDWVLAVVDSCMAPSRLQPVYGVGGEMVPPDAEIRELSGYRGSRPVRTGNSAARQVQLDVFGAVVDLVHALVECDAPLSFKHWRVVEAMVQAVVERWREPDHGIWERRMAPRHHVHSKVMCWLTLDRAAEISRRFLDRDRDDLRAQRDEIAADILAHGWNEKVSSFTENYGGDGIDASCLHVGLSGLLPPDDARFVATVAAVEKELRHGPTVFRYRSEDGLPGLEGGFHICASWLVDAYLLVGRQDDARQLFDEIAALAGPTGQLSEEFDPTTRTALGNVPQAYSHLGLIENAVALAKLAR